MFPRTIKTKFNRRFLMRESKFLKFDQMATVRIWFEHWERTKNIKKLFHKKFRHDGGHDKILFHLSSFSLLYQTYTHIKIMV